MIKAGHSDEEIKAVLMDLANSLSEKPREKGEAWLQTELKRAVKNQTERAAQRVIGAKSRGC
jgi:hypothetical protein